MYVNQQKNCIFVFQANPLDDVNVIVYFCSFSKKREKKLLGSWYYFGFNFICFRFKKKKKKNTNFIELVMP